MRIAILDPAAGISGDMTLGALIDAGVERRWLEELPQRLGFAGVQVRIERVERATLVATKVTFEVPGHDGQDRHHGEHHHGRHVGQLIELIRAAPLSQPAKRRAERAFRLVGEAEGRVHGVEPDKVHLHEVGAIDAVLDIVGAIDGFERLGVERVYSLPVAVGEGWVDTAHGQLPVPAPATANLLTGIELRANGPVMGEATTPTGAVLLRVLSEGSPPWAWRPVSTHWGAGARNPHGYPNALRLIIAEGSEEAATVEVIATDMDDITPEYLEPLREALFAAGALDCAVWPTQGKKGRVSVRLEALAPPDRADGVVAALFAHSTTAGVRRWAAARSTLARSEFEVELGGSIRVRIKVREGPFGRRFKAEYADVVAAAGTLGRPALEIAREAERLADKRLRNGEPEL